VFALEFGKLVSRLKQLAMNCRVVCDRLDGTIDDGVPNPKDYRSPMPPKGGAQLSNDDVRAVGAYVWALGHQSAR
jgi:hypothetical protein